MKLISITLLAALLEIAFAKVEWRTFDLTKHEGKVVSKRAVIYGVNNHDGGIINRRKRAVIYGVNNHDGGIVNRRKRAVIYAVNNHDGGIINKRAIINGLYNMPGGYVFGQAANRELENNGGQIGPAIITGGVNNHDGGVIY